MAELRVGTIRYDNGVKRYPFFEGYSLIEVMTPSTEYGSLSPYVLKNNKGQLMENVWQFSKVYSKIPAQTITYSRWDNRIIWKRGAETHITNGTVNDSYKKWRHDGMYASNAIRWPVGRSTSKNCLYSIKGQEDDPSVIPENSPLISENFERLDYITSRKLIYSPMYFQLVQREKQFKELVSRYESGEKLLIAEVDGPRSESIDYYIDTYGVTKNLIVNNTCLINDDTLNMFLNDPKHPYGHGFCLAESILKVARV